MNAAGYCPVGLHCIAFWSNFKFLTNILLFNLLCFLSTDYLGWLLVELRKKPGVPCVAYIEDTNEVPWKIVKSGKSKNLMFTLFQTSIWLDCWYLKLLLHNNKLATILTKLCFFLSVVHSNLRNFMSRQSKLKMLNQHNESGQKSEIWLTFFVEEWLRIKQVNKCAKILTSICKIHQNCRSALTETPLKLLSTAWSLLIWTMEMDSSMA